MRRKPRKNKRTEHSQFQEEKILQELLPKIGLTKGVCCEFGMRGLRGSNTAKLVAQGWKGQWIDARDVKIDFDGDWTHQACRIEPDNVNDILLPNIDVLSIDIDHNDYWVWRALEQRPKVVIIEITPSRKKGVGPYLRGRSKPKDLKRNEWGCSVETMKELAEAKGYEFHEQTGVNLIFVRKDGN